MKVQMRVFFEAKEILMFSVIYRHKFDMAHRLMKHPGKCRFLHGHSYVAEVEFCVEELDESEMAIDFNKIKQWVGEWIDAYWDHSVLLNVKDPLVMALEVMALGTEHRISTIEGDPTAENMAMFLAGVILKQNDDMVVLLYRVRIEETTNCFAEYYPDLS